MKKIIVLFILITASPCFATSYYVSTTGNDLSNGAITSPWKTIQKCANTIVSGDECFIKNGSYTENVTISRSGSSPYPLIFKAESSRASLINGSVNITGSYVVIDGLTIYPQANQTFGVKSTGSNNQILNCFIDGGQNLLGINNIGIYLAGQNSRVDGNFLTGTCFGSWIFGANHIVNNNELYAMKLHGTNCGDLDYMRFFGSGHVISNNSIHGVDMTNIGTAHVDCFQTFDVNGSEYSARNIIIEGNYCNGSHEGMMLEGYKYLMTNNITVRNNIFKNVSAWGINAKVITNLKVYNNTFDLSAGAIGVGCRWGSSCEFKNNIFYNGQVPYYFEKGEWVTTTYGTFPAAIMIDGTTAAPGKNNLLFKQGYNITGYANDINNKDPKFVDTAINNYNVQSVSPAIQGGKIISGWNPATDITGNLRSQSSPWTIGAYEYSGTTGSTSGSTSGTSTGTDSGTSGTTSDTTSGTTSGSTSGTSSGTSSTTTSTSTDTSSTTTSGTTTSTSSGTTSTSSTDTSTTTTDTSTKTKPTKSKRRW